MKIIDYLKIGGNLVKLKFFYIAVIFVFIPVFASRPMTSLFAKSLNASMLEIGLITACYSLAPLILAVFAGRYIDKAGEKIPIFVGSLGILLSLSLPFFSQSIIILYISQLLLGGSQLMAILAIQNGVAKSTTHANRDQAIGSFSLFSSIGMLLGPILGGYAAEHFGFQIAYAILAVLPLFSMILILFMKSDSKQNKSGGKNSSSSFKELFAIPALRKSILVSMIILSALDIFYVYFPLYAQSIGMSLSQIGWILAFQAGANSIVRIFMPKLVLYFGRVNILWVFMLIGAISYGTIPLLQSFPQLLFMAIILGTGLGVTQPLTIILSYNTAPSGQTAEVLGIRLASNRLAQTIVPFIFAILSNVVGLGFIFFIKSVLLIGGALTARGIKEINEEDKHLRKSGN